MYRVWFNGFMDRYYLKLENAQDACRRYYNTYVAYRKTPEEIKLDLATLKLYDEITGCCGIEILFFEDNE